MTILPWPRPPLRRTRGPWWHVLLVGAIVTVGLWIGQCQTVQAQEEDEWREYVRVTYYVLPGFMANGQRVHLGAAACSYGFPMGTLLEFPDGFTVECKDRGYLGRDRGWVDVWSPSLSWGRRYVTGDYGDYAWVTVVRWGRE